MLFGPCTMSVRRQPLQPSATPAANSVIALPGVNRAILAGAPVNSVPSVNQRFPSGPGVMARGWLSAVGTRKSCSLLAGAATAAPADNAKATAKVAASPRPIPRDIDSTPAAAQGDPRTPAATARSGTTVTTP